MSVIATGLSFSLLAWAVGRRCMALRTNGGVGPGDNRLLSMVWPWVVALMPVSRRLLPDRAKRIVQRTVSTAGLASERWQAEHVIALQLFSLIVFFSVSLITMLIGTKASLGTSLAVAALIGLSGGWLPYQRLQERARQRQARMLRELPFMLDMATLCVEAGQNLQGALQQAAWHGPPGPLRSELQHALSDMRAGVPRIKALQLMGGRAGLPALQSLVSLIAQAEQMGMSMGPLFRAQAQQHRAARFLRAERLALEAPVKMLFPLVICIFPCSFLIIAFPIATRLLQTGF
ncbi:type II secretion system F family protein [Allopusillimonas ginsengisoli]|uniref:type II secretion system F family protein n=1 Tax=Allopusillimonas ginsengisoli TaxID=453575 RepID=UPI001FD6BC24|nr:type II secretion system F family protein [Allopusillimonas ginsengisoli]